MALVSRSRAFIAGTSSGSSSVDRDAQAPRSFPPGQTMPLDDGYTDTPEYLALVRGALRLMRVDHVDLTSGPLTEDGTRLHGTICSVDYRTLPLAKLMVRLDGRRGTVLVGNSTRRQMGLCRPGPLRNLTFPGTDLAKELPRPNPSGARAAARADAA